MIQVCLWAPNPEMLEIERLPSQIAKSKAPVLI
jgi:hypothetical protein